MVMEPWVAEGSIVDVEPLAIELSGLNIYADLKNLVILLFKVFLRFWIREIDE